MFAKIRKLLAVILVLTAFVIFMYFVQTSLPLKRQIFEISEERERTRTVTLTVESESSSIISDAAMVSGNSSKQKGFTSSILLPDIKKIEIFLLFIGYPRSGTTLIGSLLDAHKHIIIANEYNLLTKWKKFSSEQKNKNYVYSQLINSSVSETKQTGQRAKEKKYFFSYYVPGLWQGQYQDYIKIIGDKKSTTTTRTLVNNGSYARFKELTATLNVPVKFLHLIRNPFDNIATMTLRSHSGLRMKAELEGLQMNNRATLLKQTKIYLNLIDMNSKLRKQFGRNVLDIHYSSFIRQPKIWLKTICDFLEIHCSEHYLNSCVNVLFTNETYTRRHIVWPKDIKTMVLDKIHEVDFLNGLKFEIT